MYSKTYKLTQNHGKILQILCTYDLFTYSYWSDICMYNCMVSRCNELRYTTANNKRD